MRIQVLLASLIVVILTAPTLAQTEGSSAATDRTQVEKELQELRAELEEMRQWRESVEATKAAPEKDNTREMPEVITEEMVTAHEEGDGREPRIQLPRSMSLRISGEHRTRFEYKDSVYSPADPMGMETFDYTHMRNRLRFDFDVAEDVTAVFEAQDVRTWGEEGSTTADAEGLDLKRGFIKVDSLIGDDISGQLGRFVMHYGDQRLIGHLEWVDQGRTFDGFRLSYTPDDDTYVDLFGTRIRDDAIGVVDEQDFVGIYAGINEITPGLSAEGYGLLLLDQMKAAGEVGVGNTGFVTVGTRLFGNSGAIDYSGELAYQNGDVRDDDLSAYAFAAKAGYTLEDNDWNPRFGVEVAYASGDDDPTDGDNGTFQTLFPTNHMHYGYADLVAWSNIINFRGSISVQPADRVQVAIDYHHFQLADENGGWFNAGGGLIRPGAAGADDHLGDEIDLTVKWGITEEVMLQTGWSYFLAGDFVSDTGDDPDANFFYVQAGVKF